MSRSREELERTSTGIARVGSSLVRVLSTSRPGSFRKGPLTVLGGEDREPRLGQAGRAREPEIPVVFDEEDTLSVRGREVEHKFLA